MVGVGSAVHGSRLRSLRSVRDRSFPTCDAVNFCTLPLRFFFSFFSTVKIHKSDFAHTAQVFSAELLLHSYTKHSLVVQVPPRWISRRNVAASQCCCYLA